MGHGAGNVEAAETAIRRAATNEQVIQFHVVDFMAALLCFQHQHEGRVLVDIDLIDWIHDHPDLQNLHRESLASPSSITNNPYPGHEILPPSFFPAPNNPQKTQPQTRDPHDKPERAQKHLPNSEHHT